MVSNALLNSIVAKEANRASLTPEQTRKLMKWANNWRADFTTKREHTVRDVTTATRNAAGVAKHDPTWMQ